MQMTKRPTLSGIAMVSVYAVDYDASFDFYHRILGLTDFSPMGETSCYFRFGTSSDGAPYGMYLIGKREPIPTGSQKMAKATFCFDVPSVKAWYDYLKSNGVKVPMEEPMDMGNDHFWFTAYDPSGIAIEFVGTA